MAKTRRNAVSGSLGKVRAVARKGRLKHSIHGTKASAHFRRTCLHAMPAVVFGVDFSGAADAGKKILVAECSLDLDRSGTWVLSVLQVRPASTLPGGSVKPGEATSALCAELQRHVRKDRDLIVGIDSPPSIASRFVKSVEWRTWAAKFSCRYPTPEVFREATSIATHHGMPRLEPKRETDIRHRTPFPPQNLRMYKQTWWAIKGVYAPLASAGFVVAPCMKLVAKKPVVFEACPASLLKRLGLYSVPYKGTQAKHAKRRRELVTALMRGIPIGGSHDGTLRVDVPGKTLASQLICDSGADALDAVLAAVGSACATRRCDFPAPDDGEMLDVYNIEACVYC